MFFVGEQTLIFFLIKDPKLIKEKVEMTIF